MGYIDLHCDTLHRLYYDAAETENLTSNNGHLDIDKMRGYDAQFFACHVDSKQPARRASHFEDVLAMTDILGQSADERLAFTCSYDELLANREAGRISGLLTVEEGGVLEEELPRLDTLYKNGVRLITLTWNYDNCIGGANGSDEGLTCFGYDVVERMNEMGMIIDVSHLSDKGFWNVADASKKPWVASHSNARSLCSHRRNLTDEMIRCIAEHGGVIGLNFYSHFLAEGAELTRIADLVRHAQHICNLGGSEVLALGSDFDGIDCSLEMADCSEMWKLPEALESEGFLADMIDAICWRNADKYLKEVL